MRERERAGELEVRAGVSLCTGEITGVEMVRRREKAAGRPILGKFEWCDVPAGGPFTIGDIGDGVG